jgi:hypothetical protein
MTFRVIWMDMDNDRIDYPLMEIHPDDWRKNLVGRTEVVGIPIYFSNIDGKIEYWPKVLPIATKKGPKP